MTRLDAKRLEIAELIAVELGFDDLEGMGVVDRAMIDQHTDEAIDCCAEHLAIPADDKNSNIRLRHLLKQHTILYKL
ncbi:hypothetical protein MKK58_04520 [Methylobacterium sp. J-078]|uniref:hypothetical protein n=1 Tax=Methylobacterium sp. J-078 TaxID=2836657 RepID=UPI001FBAA830|nr:hypothetical protein [Methylobacterium sp. J-078]MCJ2043801.1 hypothetical protein [Methylobacterium sp. J-078]